MTKHGCVEQCTDCLQSAATADVMWKALPVPYFGDVSGARVKVATLGLNPSRTEFVTQEGVWRETGKRLPAVMDFEAEGRRQISGADARRAAEARTNYFTTDERDPNTWFKSLQGIMRGAGRDWSYAGGTAVHLDLVACATWEDWAELGDDAIADLLKNCKPKFLDTLEALRSEAWLLLDGRTAYETVMQCCGGVAILNKRVGDNSELEVWRGHLSSEFRQRNFLGWSKPVIWQNNQLPLVAWLRTQPP